MQCHLVLPAHVPVTSFHSSYACLSPISMVSLEEQVLVDGVPEKQVQQRRYPAISPDEVRRRILGLGVSEENVHRHFPVDPETFANNT